MAQLIGWSFVGAFGLIARVVLYGDAALALAMTICTDGCAFVLTSTFHLAVTRRGAVQVTWQLIAIAVLLVIPAATLISLLGRTLLAMQGRSLPFWSEGDIGFVPFVYYAAILLGWCLAYFWISTDIGRRNRRLIRVEAELAEARAELSHLRAQLEPQFLLGALDRISDEMANNPAGAAPLVRQAATFLHHTLESRARPISTLDAELESVRAYFAVKPTGHDVSLPIEFDVDEAARSRAIPHLVLQTLVDNAVKHGASSRGKIRVKAQVVETALILTVINRGMILPADGRTGSGLSNLERRLALHYPGSHAFSLTEVNGTVVARLVLDKEPQRIAA